MVLNQTFNLTHAVFGDKDFVREPLSGLQSQLGRQTDRLGAFDESGTTNLSVCRAPDGRFVMVYKCWSKEPLFNGRVSIGAAFADRPEGPWRRLDSPIFDAPGVQFAAEDPCVFSQGGRLHCLLKDMGSYY